MPRSPRFTQLGIGLARHSGHELGGFPESGLQLRVSRRALAVLRSRVEPRTCCGGDVFRHPLDVGLGQLANAAGADQPCLLAYLAQDLPADALRCGAEGSNLR